MISVSKFIFSFFLKNKKEKKIVAILSPRYCNKKIVINYLNNFYSLSSTISMSSVLKLKKKKRFFFLMKVKFFLQKKKFFSLFFSSLKKIKKILHYDSMFLKLIQKFTSEIHIDPNVVNNPCEILYYSGYFTSSDFSLPKARNVTYDRIFKKGWFI